MDNFQGIEIKEISDEVFREFARNHATSEEVGRIATYMDEKGQAMEKPVEPAPMGEPIRDKKIYLLGLFGCEKLCAATCCVLSRAQEAGPYGCKLDSVIVDKELRRRGLATGVVAQAFLNLIEMPGAEISTFFAHSVHPGTVRLLRKWGFSDPPPVGAPISSLSVDDTSREALVDGLTRDIRELNVRLRLQCAFCQNRDRRARPWCKAG